MNDKELNQLRDLIESLGYQMTGVLEQRIVSTDNRDTKGTLVITYQARTEYCAKLEKE
jgi:hypothetical protein